MNTNISPSTDKEIATIQLTQAQQNEIPKFIAKLLKKKKFSSLKRIKFFVTDNETISEEARAHVRKNILHFPFK